MKIILSLKRKWWDMITQGKKEEEYREFKDFWVKRLLHSKEPITEVEFTLGYPKSGDSSRRRTYKVEDIKIGLGRQEWGAPNHRVIIIKFRKI